MLERMEARTRTESELEETKVMVTGRVQITTYSQGDGLVDAVEECKY